MDAFENKIVESNQTLIRNVVTAARGGHVIAVIGGLMSGKTTIMRQIRRELQKRNEVLISMNMSIEKDRINFELMTCALFLDIADKTNRIPRLKNRLPKLVEIISEKKKSVAHFIDDAHHLKEQTFTDFKRFQQIAIDAGSVLSLILFGRSKLIDILNQTIEDYIVFQIHEAQNPVINRD